MKNKGFFPKHTAKIRQATDEDKIFAKDTCKIY